MSDILHVGKLLQLRKAQTADLDYIMKLEYDKENLKYIPKHIVTFALVSNLITI